MTAGWLPWFIASPLYRPEYYQPLYFFHVPPANVPIRGTYETVSVTGRIKINEPVTEEQKKAFKEGRAVLEVKGGGFMVRPVSGPYNHIAVDYDAAHRRFKFRTMVWYWGAPPVLSGTLEMKVDRRMKYDPGGEYYRVARLDEDLIGEEIEFTAFSWRPKWVDHVYWVSERVTGLIAGTPPDYAAIAGPGVYDQKYEACLCYYTRGDIPTSRRDFESFLYAQRRYPIYRPKLIDAAGLYAALASFGYRVTRDAVRDKYEQWGDIDFAARARQIINTLAERTDTWKLPDVKYLESSFPDIVAAAEPFTALHKLYNQGHPGKAELRLTADGEKTTLPFSADRVTNITENLTMPWDDFTRNYLAEIFTQIPKRTLEITQLTLAGYTYTPVDVKDLLLKLTDSKTFYGFVRAGFPLPVLGDIDVPEIAKPGERVRAILPVTNQGYRGDVGVRIRAPGFERDVMERIDCGASIMPAFEGEMPAAEIYRISVTPIHLGRNRVTIEGEERIIEVKPINCLLHWENFITIRGGYRELNPVTGFVAGKNLRIRGLDASIGIGGPPFLPYGGYILSGNLGPGDIATIEYDELYYLKVETGKEIATAMLGSLIERATTVYEYSVIPTPAMALRVPKAFGVMLTEAVPRLEV